MNVERQTTFGWTVAIDIFLGGAGGGIFLISFILNSLGKYEALTRIGSVLGPILVIAGAAILFLDLGVKNQWYRLFYNKSSWMTRGSWIILAFIPVSLAYSVPQFWYSGWTTATLANVIGIAAALLAILVSIYPGFFFGVIKRIPLWNRTALPLLFLSSSLCSGIAVLLLIGSFLIIGLNDNLSALVINAIIVTLAHLLLILLFLAVAGNSGTIAIESVRLFKNPLIVGTVIVIGLVAPLILLVLQTVITFTLVILTVSALLLLTSNLILRYSILTAGIRLPPYPL
jgi:formate-dependent nitrite reductase membrane component NrfD